MLFHFILAYAEDMLLIARSAEDLQALLHLINVLARNLGLKFNTNKCTTLHYNTAGCRSTIFNLAGSEIPQLEDGTLTIFLCKPIDAFLPRDSVTSA